MVIGVVRHLPLLPMLQNKLHDGRGIFEAVGVMADAGLRDEDDFAA